MNRIILTVIIAISILLVGDLRAQVSEGLKDDVDRNNSLLIIKDKIIGSEQRVHNFNPAISEIDSSKLKSPFIGAGLSAIIPGAGQFYAKNYLKTAIFLAVEAGLWINYAL